MLINIPEPSGKTVRYLSLDVLRGIAALSVVVWHWQHFFFSKAHLTIDLPDKTVLPLYKILRPFYEGGYLAVDLFFAISGFIFFCFYAKTISERVLAWRSFVLLRFSRLYPLHFLTLVLVALLQILYLDQNGGYFVYQANDWHRFILQLFFASNWLPNDVSSFNGPIWSVSIEILLYANFFLVCRLALTRPVFLLFASLAGAILFQMGSALGGGLFSFFLGGLCFYASSWIRGLTDRYVIAAKCGLLVMIVASLIALNLGVLYLFSSVLLEMASSFHGKDIQPLSLEHWLRAWYWKAFLFPALIIVLAITENELKKITTHLAWIGDITYSSYLIHFPLQLCFVLFSTSSGIRINYLSITTLVVYFTVLIALSVVTFRWFEKPMQDLLRRKAGLERIRR